MYQGGLRLPKADGPETWREKARRARPWVRRVVVPSMVREAWTALTLPASAYFLLNSPRIDPAYRMTFRSKTRLAWRLYRTTRLVFTGTSYKAHLAMASKLLEIPPSVEGVVVECGSFQGGSTANLSIICDVVGRDLVVYDSFEGLPPPSPGDKVASEAGTGLYAGSLETVQENVRRCGVIERCTFRKGWFADTTPSHTEPIVLAFFDVDYQQSIHDCMVNLWKWLVPKGYLFLDEYVLNDYCALLWSERYWQTYFGTPPPGLIGSGSGVGVGHYYLGPWDEWQMSHSPTSVAYTRKDFVALWDFYPDEARAGHHEPDPGPGADRPSDHRSDSPSVRPG
jgi:hypothetical protein